MTSRIDKNVCMYVALLPEDLFSLAMEVIEAYEEGELCPPQNKRREVTSSSFNFLTGLDPLKEKDQSLIERHLKKMEINGGEAWPEQAKNGKYYYWVGKDAQNVPKLRVLLK